MRLFKNIALILLTLAGLECLVGCGKDNIDGGGTIKVKVRTAGNTKASGVINEDGSATQDCLAAYIVNLQEEGFIMDAQIASDAHDNSTDAVIPAGKYFRDEVGYSGGWATKTPQYWINNVDTHFWCWNKKAADHGLSITETDVPGSDVRSFLFSVPAASNRGDVILACSKDKWMESDGDSKLVELTFYHPLTHICFSLKDDYSSNFTIKQISLKNVKTEGDFTFTRPSTFTWGIPSSETDVVESGLNITDSNGAIDAVHFYMVPQALSERTVLSIEFEYMGIPVTREAYLYVESDDATHQWLTGKFYRYRISATSLNPIGFSVSLEEWAPISGGEINPNAPTS